MSRDQIIKYLNKILANKDTIQKVTDLNFDKEVQVKIEMNELERIILRNRHLGRPDRDGKEEIIDEIEELIKEKANELKNLFATDNDLIDLLLWLDEVIKDLKTVLKH